MLPVLGRAAGLAAVAVLGWQVLARGLDFSRASAPLRFIHGVDLVIHEAGHALLFFFGPFLHALGGSLLQVALPAAFAAYFLRHGRPASFAVTLFWTGESLTDVAIYVADARAMALPLLGGGHDWNYLLGTLDLLGWAAPLGWLTWATGLLAIAAALVVLAADLARAWTRAAEPAPRARS